MCVCVCIYIYMCVCMCVCLSVYRFVYIPDCLPGIYIDIFAGISSGILDGIYFRILSGISPNLSYIIQSYILAFHLASIL